VAEVALLLVVFAVVSVVSYALITRVPQRLHTPLMSFTNAISAVTILGALLIFATSGPSSTGTGLSPVEMGLGAVAVVLAAFNLIGGFAVTDRMTRMFKR
jgi:H+-translocating NAD(P) transhydrogenase subunit alpha